MADSEVTINPETLASLRSLAEIWEDQGRHADAIRALNEVIGYCGKGLEDGDANLGATYVVLAKSLSNSGRLAEAEVAAREARTRVEARQVRP